MIIIIALAVIILGIVFCNCKTETFEKWGLRLFFIGGLLSFIFILIFTMNHVGSNREYILKQEEYEALTYKVENVNSQDDFNLNGKAIIDEVCEWNKEIRNKQYLTNNIWVGIFWPEFWNELELIDYNIYQRS